MEAENRGLVVLSKRDLRAKLSRLAISADGKVVLEKIMETTIKVGEVVFELGRRLLSFVFDLVKRFRGIAFGVGVALTVSMLVAATPLVGGALAALLTPLLVAFGLTMGALEDVRNGALRDHIAEFSSDVDRQVARA
jgi:hypothetical protein